MIAIRRRRRALLGGAVWLLLFLTACQPEQAVPVAGRAETAVPSLTPSATSAAATPTLVPPPPLTVIAAEPVPPTAAPTTPPTETAVPPPTATSLPPTSAALPYTAPDEHYWFLRPIREGATNWTDKVYSYGSTRRGTLRPHHGVEFYVPTGTDVIAAADGMVRVAGNDAVFNYGPANNFYGNLIIIEHDARWEGQPVYTLYAHLSEILVSEGQRVLVQQLIGKSGATGVADGPHLHFEVRVGENSYAQTRNPLLWLYPFPDRGVAAGRVLTTEGELLEGLNVVLAPVGGGDRRSQQGFTYTGQTVNPDPLWNENFVVDDIFGGLYKATVTIGQTRFSEEVMIQPYQTSFVEIVVDLSIVPPTATPTETPTYAPPTMTATKITTVTPTPESTP